jgi:hypothetical protein
MKMKIGTLVVVNNTRTLVLILSSRGGYERTGAGFYLDATHPKWSMHYNMLTHVTQELPQVLEAAGLPLVRPSVSVALFPARGSLIG